MAIVTSSDEEKMPIADRNRPGREADDRDERDEAPQRPQGATPKTHPAVGQPGFFHLYKPGQGYWTRMGTALASALIVLLLAQFLYTTLQTRTKLDWKINPATALDEAGFPVWKLIIAGIFTLASFLLLWWYQNKPDAVDFLVATESEMKKVNWTSRKDLIGSTKVVIAFMFMISTILFVIDILFGYFFWLIDVLKTPPI